MSFMFKLKWAYHELMAPRISLDFGTHTPILFEDYQPNTCYYMINNNKDLIYNLDEIYEIIKKKPPIDPFTRLPIYSLKIVRILITK